MTDGNSGEARTHRTRDRAGSWDWTVRDRECDSDSGRDGVGPGQTEPGVGLGQMGPGQTRPGTPEQWVRPAQTEPWVGPGQKGRGL